MGEGFNFCIGLYILGEVKLVIKKIKLFGFWVKVCELFNVIIVCCFNY